MLDDSVSHGDAAFCIYVSISGNFQIVVLLAYVLRISMDEVAAAGNGATILEALLLL